jgi:hypothetical protein
MRPSRSTTRPYVLKACAEGCFRNRLLVVGSQPLVAKALAIDFELAGSCRAKPDCNRLLPIILD